MRMRVGVMVGVLLGVVCGGAWANDGAVIGVGGSVKLMRGHPAVVMKSAKIRIHLASERVECVYVMHNTGAAAKVLVGFPESSEGADVGPDDGFRDFRAYVDGQQVAVKARPGKEDDSGFRRFWVKEVDFAPGQTRTVRNTYTGGGGGTVMGDQSFTYELSPAASWKGKVETVEVEVDLSGMGSFLLQSVEPRGHKRSGNTIRWQWSSIEPKPEMDISISYFTGYDDIWIGGRKCAIARAAGGGSNPYPKLEKGVVTARCEDIGKWLGLKFAEDEEGQAARATLTDQGKRLVITEGQRAAQLDGKRVELGAEAHRRYGVDLWAPLKPVAEAFGGRVRFDPLTKRTYVHTAKALAGARRPQWLERALTEADLRGKSPAELRDMRNGIYAGRGREFQNRELRHRFYCEPWYQPDPRYSDALPTELDRANLALIRKAEGEQGSGG